MKAGSALECLSFGICDLPVYRSPAPLNFYGVAVHHQFAAKFLCEGKVAAYAPFFTLCNSCRREHKIGFPCIEKGNAFFSSFGALECCKFAPAIRQG